MKTPVPSPPETHTVTLFVTCLVDMIYPEVGEAVVELLEERGLQVAFPEEQTCCGQPAYNAGYWEDARLVALRFLEVFGDAEVIVAPSGSCVAMVRHGYAHLLADHPAPLQRAQQVAKHTWEFSQFLVEGLGVVDVGASFQGRIAYHDSCHLARELGITRPPRELLRHVRGAQLVELPGHDECCGFGGLFSVKMPEISSAMLARKLQAIQHSGADVVVTGDVSCMTQINGGLRRSGMSPCVWHLAHFLAAHRRGGR